MITKVRISFKKQEDKLKVIAALKPLGIVKISKEQEKPGHKNIYIELGGVKNYDNA